ncbi:Uncharacterized protein Rs2_50759 [Raphanus sativus]|uniref:Uncharacterized protein LOC130494496 n=1 Tax=Raphanus sativus TaxID=3726 RepID=A0A9W3CXR2_RAPSA|nr:PREDICTED: uncharacterized protein LOC108824290 isoform X2 [Raphanus sativus]XP_056856354.1 uncharacterized protein LOC130494496 [Raphanus sativus]KAJ4867695.1 Uncharacterized protein Rs2_50759 [Raphanus sativus]
MASKSYHPLHLIILFVYAVAISSSFLAVRSHEQNNGDEEMRSRGGGGRRLLLGFKETPKGSNVTFECSPSGPCVSCNSSEKRKDKYRCSETGYRIPFKCREVRGGGGEEASSHKKDAEETTQQNDQEVVDASVKQRNLRDDDSSSSPASKAKKSQSYKTYRSCVPSADEERVSVLGFEAVMLGLLLVSGSAVYYRKKQIIPMAGVSSGRSQSNSRF